MLGQDAQEVLGTYSHMVPEDVPELIGKAVELQLELVRVLKS